MLILDPLSFLDRTLITIDFSNHPCLAPLLLLLKILLLLTHKVSLSYLEIMPLSQMCEVLLSFSCLIFQHCYQPETNALVLVFCPFLGISHANSSVIFSTWVFMPAIDFPFLLQSNVIPRKSCLCPLFTLIFLISSSLQMLLK